jgi:hypothetical protein
MSSAFAFISKMGLAKAGRLGDSFTQALVKFDPETASQVDIDDMTQHARDLAARVAEAESKEERDHQKVTDLTASLTRYSKAAQVLATQVQAATAANNKVTADALTAQMNTLLDQMEVIGGKEGDGSVSGTLFDANQDHIADESDLHEWQQVHAGAVASLQSVNARLERARSDMQHASEQESRAKERQAQMERDQGLKSGLNTGSVALSAMLNEAEEAKKRARAATINVNAMKASTATSADDIAAQVAASVAPTPSSALDRLARMTGKAA